MSGNSRYELVNATINTNDPRANATTISQSVDQQTELVALARQLILAQTKQNELLQEIVNQLGLAQRQRNMELAQWKQANPKLANACKLAAERLGKIQTDFLANLASEVDDSFENLQDSEYMLNEFFDKYGPRIIHLNTLLQTLAALGNAPDLPKSISNP